MPMEDLKGGCHCGAVRFEAKADTSQAIECNCSHCADKGFMLTFTPRENFTLTSGEDKLTEYRFNKHVSAHQFCSVCGQQPFAFAAGKDGIQMAAINLCSVDGLDVWTLTPTRYDGKSK